jgi:REP element-mobilizing transposase RayT
MARSFSSIVLHVIFSTKDRLPNLVDENIQKKLHSYLGGILQSKKCLPISIGGVADHIHVLADFCRDEAVSEVVKELKRSSTLWLRDQNDLYRGCCPLVGRCAANQRLNSLTLRVV